MPHMHRVFRYIFNTNWRLCAWSWGWRLRIELHRDWPGSQFFLFFFFYRGYVVGARFTQHVVGKVWNTLRHSCICKHAAWQRTMVCQMVRKRPHWMGNQLWKGHERVKLNLYGFLGSQKIKWQLFLGPSGEMKERAKWSTSWQWTLI